eukprot:gene46753-62547_t
MTTGETVVSIPSSICIFAQRSGEVKGLLGQTDFLWDVCGDLRHPVSDDEYAIGRTWDVQLALALMDATAGTGLGGDFWDTYTNNLPPPETLTLPFCMPEDALSLIRDTPIYIPAKKQQQRLHNLFPDLDNRDCHRITSYSMRKKGFSKDDIPSPLQWAFALIRSRCFQATSDMFAVVPVLDLINHNFNPNC